MRNALIGVRVAIRKALPWLLSIVAGNASAQSAASLAAAPFSAPQLSGLIDAPGVEEISGMAASTRSDNLLWVINDSGNTTELHALDVGGTMQGRVRVRGVRNLDWEDLNAFRLNGQAYLMVADTGDNGAIRAQINLLIIEEPRAPGPGKVASIAPAWTVHVRYPKGPRDCEAVAVDEQAMQVLLLTKRRVPAELYRVPLKPKKPGIVTARLLGLVPNIPQPTAEELANDPHWGRYRSQPTSMDVAPDRSRVLVLTYRHAFVFERLGKETWAEAFSRPPSRINLPLLPQAEAMTFSRQGKTLFLTTERLPAPLLRFEELPPAAK